MTFKIDDAPGLRWRQIGDIWEGRWRARGDLVRAGFKPKSVRVWYNAELPGDIAIERIRDTCQKLQGQMSMWRQTPQIIDPNAAIWDGSLRGLIRCYQNHTLSDYRKLRYASRVYYDRLLTRIDRERGEVRRDDGTYRLRMLSEIRSTDVLVWHQEWSADGKIAMGHAIVTMLRTIIKFGSSVMEDEDMRSGEHCARLATKLGQLRLRNASPRDEVLTADHVVAIRAKAHELGRPSLALEQALQFDLTLRQKDVVGEWVPNSEPGISDVVDGNEKWLRGLRWEEIDDSLTLTHVTSKRQKKITISLRQADMVLEEFAFFAKFDGTRASLPARGPIVVNEETGRPYTSGQFRHWWRKVANAAGVPRHIRNQDTRAGAITEATRAGAPLESIRHAATHSNIGMTQRYAREADQKITEVMEARRRYRNKTGTE